MNWERRVISDEELEPYVRREGWLSLPIRVEALIEHQKAHWPLFARGCESLPQAAIKEIPIGDFSVLAQHNPGRITSTTAQVDRESIEARPCFLCPENLPPEEKGVQHGENVILLCNPYPILARHLTIVHRRHIPQAIAGNLETMFDLAHDLGSDYFVLYNGPMCGASAPDHLHFQAAARDHLPIEVHLRAIEQSVTDRSTGRTGSEARGGMRDIHHESRILHHPSPITHRATRIRLLASTHEGEVFTLEGYHVKVLIYRGSNWETLTQWLEKTLELLGELTGAEPEPMINLIVTADQGTRYGCQKLADPLQPASSAATENGRGDQAWEWVNPLSSSPRDPPQPASSGAKGNNPARQPLVSTQVFGSQCELQRVAQGEVRRRRTEPWGCQAIDQSARETGDRDGIDLSPASQACPFFSDGFSGFRFAPRWATFSRRLHGLDLRRNFRRQPWEQVGQSSSSPEGATEHPVWRPFLFGPFEAQGSGSVLQGKQTHRSGSQLGGLNSVPLAEQDSCSWTVFLFPRSKHRPRCYYTDRESRLTISPAAIDLAGLVVVPIREHFERLSSNDLRQIFSEVTLAEDVFDELIKRLE